MPFCRREEVDIYYEVHGSGEPLLFISGLSGGSWSWFLQKSFFEQWYRVIVFDNRGAGRSSIPSGPYTMQEMALDVVALMDCLNLDRFYVAGISMGGMIAQQVATMIPERIKALVLGCTHCGRTYRVAPSREVLKTLTSNEGLKPEEILDKNVPLLFGQKCREEHPEIVAAYKNSMLAAPIQSIEAFNAQISAINSFDVGDYLYKISAPTLIITGAEDILVPPDNSRVLAKLIPNSQLVEIDGVGHAIHLECYDTFNKLLLGFFQSNKDH